ncbi:MAG: SBBP repeat-containing protein [Bacteroidetes bacterium]|nr:SBBP repeat-containing protein [Bacteroidota bacterium]
MRAAAHHVRCFRLPALLLLILIPGVVAAQRSGDSAPHHADRRAWHGMAPGFVENRGQLADENGNPRPDLLFQLKFGGTAIYLAADRIHYLYERPSGGEASGSGGHGEARRRRAMRSDSITAEACRMDLEFLGGNPGVHLEAQEQLPGVENYILGNCPAGVLGVRRYHTVTYHDLYPNIDLVLYAGHGGMTYDFVVHRGGHPDCIRMRYNGAGSVALTQRGALRVAGPLGSLSEQPPIAYQTCGASGARLGVRCRFVRRDSIVTFDVGAYNGDRDLVIDPAQEWATFYGGGGPTFFDMDYFSGGDVTEIDGSGNCILIGNTLSATFPTTPGALRRNLQGVIDAFIVKFDPYGNVLWATYYGGTNGDDYGHGVVADGQGNIIVTGHTGSTDIPRVNAYQNAFAGGVQDAYVAKFSPAGALLWGTYCGTAFWDDCYASAVDSAGNVYALMTTTGGVLAGAPVAYRPARNAAHPTGGGPVNNDLMMVKFNGTSGQAIWAKFIGGANVEYGYSVVCDVRGNVIATGWTNSTDFPVTPGCAQAVNGGGYDAVVVKVDSAGTMLWSTYYGGSGTEDNGLFPLAIIGDFGVAGVATDGGGNVFLTGATTGGFPTTAGAWNRNPIGGTDAFAVKFDSLGTVRWATYIGTAGSDYGMGVACNQQGGVIVAGTTTANGLPTNGAGQDAPFQAAYNNGADDAFLAKLDANGAPKWVTYFGGPGDDAGHGVSCDPHGAVLLAGETNSAGAPFMLRSRHQVANNQQLAAPGNAGGYDAYLTLFCDADPPRLDSSGTHTLCDGDTLRVWIPHGYANVKWYRKDPPTFATSTELLPFRGRDTIAIADSGRYYVAVENAAGCASTAADVVVARFGRINPGIAPAAPVTICTGDTVVLSVGPGTFAQYRWLRAPGVTEGTPTMKVWAGGTYAVVVTNAAGCRDSATVTVQEYPKPSPISASGDTAICQGGQAVLSASGGAGGSISWYAAGGPAAVGSGAQYVATTSGTYYARSTNAGGCTAQSNTVAVRVGARPRPKIVPVLPVEFCDGDSTILDAVPAAPGDAVLPGGNYRSCNWFNGTAGTRIVLRDVPIGPTRVGVTVTDTNGCTADTFIVVTKDARPKPGIVANPDTIVCEGDSVTLSASGTFAGYLWNTGSTDSRITVGRSAAYVLAVTSAEGCSGTSDTVRVIVHARPSAKIAGPVAVCLNSTQAYSVPAQAGVSYAWKIVGASGAIGGGAGSSSVSVDWGAAADVRVIVTVTDNATGCAAHDTLPVKVGSVLQPNIVTSRSPHLCPGDTVQLDAGAGFSTYNWSTGAATRTIAVWQAGSYSVTVANASGCSGTSSPLVVSVADPLVPVITPGRSLVLCSGDTVELDAGAGFAEYLWSNGATLRKVRVTAGGTYQVATRDTNGCRAASKPVEVVVNAPPAPSINGPNSACVGSVLAFATTAASGDIITWNVRGPGAQLLAGQGTDGVTVRCGSAGEDTVEITVRSSATGCSGTARYLVGVGTSLQPVIGTDRALGQLCAGDSIRLSVPPGYASYRWSPAGETTPSIVVRTAGTYSVVVTDSGGCTGSAEIAVTVKPPFRVPLSPAAAVLCPGDSVRLDAGAGFSRYSWWPGGEQAATLWAHAPGRYAVSAVDADGCPGTSDTITVTAGRAPLVTGIDQTGDLLTVQVDEVNGPAAVGVQWLRDGVPIAGATSRTYTTPAVADYSVIATSADGCSAMLGPVRPAAAASSEIGVGDIAAAPGEHVLIPLVMASSQNLDRVGAHAFEARLRFNKTLLIPADQSNSTIAADERIVTVRGTRAPNMETGELLRLEFTAALGNDSVTALRLEGFRWLDTAGGAVSVQVQSGTFHLIGICESGGTRLLAAAGLTKIAAMRPNPATGIVEIEYDIAERGFTELYLADMRGERAATLVQGILTPGRYLVAFDTDGMPSGSYRCVLATPTERLTRTLSIVH